MDFYNSSSQAKTLECLIFEYLNKRTPPPHANLFFFFLGVIISPCCISQPSCLSFRLPGGLGLVFGCHSGTDLGGASGRPICRGTLEPFSQSNKIHCETQCQYRQSDLYCDITLYNSSSDWFAVKINLSSLWNQPLLLATSNKKYFVNFKLTPSHKKTLIYSYIPLWLKF